LYLRPNVPLPYVLSVLLPVKEDNMTKISNRWLVALTATSALCLMATTASYAQSLSEELSNTATTACVDAAKAKGFQLKKVVSVAPKGADGATAVLALTRSKQLFKLTCGYTKAAGASIGGDAKAPAAAASTPEPVAAAPAPSPAAAAPAGAEPAAVKQTLGSAAPCKDVPAFQEKKTAALAAVDEQIAKAAIPVVPTFTIIPGVTGSQSLKQEWQDKKARLQDKFARYEKPGVLCGVDDGNPRLIADGRLDHLGDFIIPSILFLYVAGALGWAGRDYLIKANRDANLEIMIDTPKAIQSLVVGLLWPAQAIPAILSGSIRDDSVKP
jgi:photosystem I subunit III